MDTCQHTLQTETSGRDDSCNIRYPVFPCTNYKTEQVTWLLNLSFHDSNIKMS